MDKRWKILKADQSKVAELRNALNINERLCSILVQRGIDTFEKARAYFRPQLSELHDPFLMKDMRKAVDRIVSAFNSRQRILVFGDYDVDGTTSVACVYDFLAKIYDPHLLDFYIPHRYREGYGVSKAGIDFAAANNFSLVISLDCGIKSVELISYAKSLGIDFIICDHHLPDPMLPIAVAILNPKQPGCNYPTMDLSGSNFGIKLISALAMEFWIDDRFYQCNLDLLATSIAAYIVPMIDENRILAHHVLQRINTQPRPGIAALS